MWSVGGLAPNAIATDDGQGHLVRRGTNARVFPTLFQESLVSTSVEKEKHEGRIASALNIDQVRKILEFARAQQIPQSLKQHGLHTDFSHTSWNGYQWVNKEEWSIPLRPAKRRLLPAAPFRVLDAPNLKDDFYCSPLAYSYTAQTLVVCLGSLLYAWSEFRGMGNIYYYLVEWPIGWEVTRNPWPGAVSLVAKISNIHCQQVCGLAWSYDGRLFASGGNDNLCCLFDADQVSGRRTEQAPGVNGHRGRIGAGSAYGGIETRVTRLLSVDGDDDMPVRAFRAQLQPLPTGTDTVRYLGPAIAKHHWNHDAAVKAIAFCPWRRELVATGGGSNDKCIHFFHTPSGAALATISVSAQVTSLIWNTTRREIAATFGYASPEHPYRVSVFSWPECKQVAAIPWEDDLRALYAISYPRGPTSEDPTAPVGGKEGCIIVASSDKSIKFHEVWSRERGVTVGATGILAGSDILEGLEGIDKEGDVIR
ncbi:Meiosis-specific APC/C activator protein AMA1 [Fusarium odoratissimum]|uniref:Meiosis-specific APC/C activator protein AMA1 n=1 Tax=Fusarium oxysporum f. sp. cubense (strain race 4) TaxID=2502994 RepID=N1S4Q7_FUSC4|nr:Meiosis-specific APC/C activator protein AMA1 [Fusarium odoratissimum]